MSQYSNRILHVRSFLIKSREVFSDLGINERDEDRKNKSTTLASIKFRIVFTNKVLENAGEKIAYQAASSRTSSKPRRVPLGIRLPQVRKLWDKLNHLFDHNQLK